MHSFTDIAVGSILGISVTLLQSSPGFQIIYNTTPIATASSILILLWLIFYGLPAPKDACPCWFDSICAGSVLIGVVFGAFMRTIFPFNSALPATKAEAAVYVSVGAMILIVWKVFAAIGIKKLGVPIWTRFHLPLKVSALEVGKAKSCEEDSASVSATDYSEVNSKSKSAKTQKEKIRLFVPWYALEAVLKIVVYAGIGILSSFAVPVLLSFVKSNFSAVSQSDTRFS
jgi:hypothetical protein